MRIFGQALLVEKQKQKASYLCKTTSKKFEFLHKSYAIAIAMAAVTFQYGGYFGFKVILPENDISVTDYPRAFGCFPVNPNVYFIKWFLLVY
jgi:hypothetical protein